MGDRRGEALARLKALAAEPVVPLGEVESDRLLRLAVELHEERFLARPGFRIAMRGLLALIAVEVARLAASPPGVPWVTITSGSRRMTSANSAGSRT